MTDGLILAQVIARLVASGIASFRAFDDAAFNEEDLAALASNLQTSALLPSLQELPENQRISALHLALVCSAFGAALARHWEHHGKLTKPRLKAPRFLHRLLKTEAEKRLREHELLAQTAHIELREPGNINRPTAEVKLVEVLSGPPEGTPYFQTPLRGLLERRALRWGLRGLPRLPDRGPGARVSFPARLLGSAALRPGP